MAFLKKRPLILIFALGLLLRIILLFYDYSWDINNHIVWAKDLWQRGFRGFYETQSSEVYASPYPNYPPLSTFIFYLFYPLQSITEKVVWQLNLAIPLFPSKLVFFIQSRTFLAAVLKLPAVLADLGIAYICYLFSKKLSNNHVTDKLITCLLLFNPVFFYLSALWGQIDSIPIFFALLAFYIINFSDKYYSSALAFTAAVLVKPTAFVFLPAYIFFFIRKYGFINLLKTSLLSIIIFYISFIPFLKNLNNFFLPFQIFSEKVMAAQSLSYVSNGAINFWVLVTGFKGIKDTTPFLFGLSYRLWGYIVTGVFVFLTLSSPTRSGIQTKLDSRFRGNDKIQQIFYATFLIAFAAFLFLTKMHERYSLLPLPFLLLASINKSPKGRSTSGPKWFIILSLISLINLYHSWPVPKLGAVTDFIYLPFVTNLFSLANVLIFFYLLNDFAKIKHANNRRSSASF